MASLVTVGIGVVGVGVLLGLSTLRPPPPLSPRILDWQARGKFFNFKGHSIYYQDVRGEGDRGAVICLHGFPTFSWDWVKVLPGLKTQYSRIIMLDFLGFGLSDKPYPHAYSLFEQADIVEALASSLEIESAHLLAHDYGDTVAQELLFRHNQGEAAITLTSVVLLNGGVFPETNHPRPVQKLLLIPGIGQYLGRFVFYLLFKRGFGNIFGENQPSEEEFMDFYAALRNKDGQYVQSSLLNYIQERHNNRDRWVNKALKEATIPVLMIYGPADPVNPHPFQDHFRKEAPGHQIAVLQDTVGHYPQWEDSEAVVFHIKKFLKEIP